ncbi:hypothetical protein BDF19DRAFT_493168 [Syncephalis fuscata]|nr:hypothetical protein BDF19DRAFT_493168 [Syncephalis fuscata]
MKSIIAATVTALMLVSIAQVAPVNGMPGLSKSTSKSKPEPEPIKFMGFENNDPKSPFTIHGIHFTKPPYKVDGVHYIKGTQHSQPITLACGTYSSPSNNAFQLYISGNRCYIIPGQCEQTYKRFADSFYGTEQHVKSLWQNIGLGLKAIKEAGWYAHMDFDSKYTFIADAYINDITRYLHSESENGEYKPCFINFNNAIPVGKELIKIKETNEFVMTNSFYLVPYNTRIAIVYHLKDYDNRKYNWDSFSKLLSPPDMSILDHGLLKQFANTLDAMLLDKTEK